MSGFQCLVHVSVYRFLGNAWFRACARNIKIGPLILPTVRIHDYLLNCKLNSYQTFK